MTEAPDHFDTMTVPPGSFPVTPVFADGKRERKSHVWDRDPHDYYVEPSWVSERLFAVEQFDGGVIDPACGSGRIVRAANEAGLWSQGSDVVRRGDRHVCATVVDFLSDDFDRVIAHHRIDNIVCNPPFNKAQAFVEKALRVAERKVAMLLPSTWSCGDARSRWLQSTPLLRKLDITPRPSMPPGAVIEAGQPAGNGTKDFAFYVWLRGYNGAPSYGWLRRAA